jgi:phosphatidylglycerophosphate synthase
MEHMVRREPLIGLAGQIVVLVAVGLTIGIGVDGWVVGLAYGLVTCVALGAALTRAGVSGLGRADWVTLSRATLVGAVTALVVDSFRAPATVPALVTIATVALVLDAVDGQVARRTGTVSPLGARFDMEVDAFLILVLSVYVAGMIGPWVLAIGAMRYAYVAAGWLLPWLRRPVPPRYWRKVVAATQGVTLTAVASGLFPTPVSVAAVGIALALLIESFGRDIVGQWRARSRDLGRTRVG